MNYGIRHTVGGHGVPAGDEYIPWLAARTYQEHRQLREILKNEFVGTICELGCGYGRMTPVLTEFAFSGVYAFERDLELFDCAVKNSFTRKIDFQKVESLTNLPLFQHGVDLVFTYTVLQHIPPGEIEKVCQEISRITRYSGLVIICEDDSLQKGPETWGRTSREYADMIGGSIQRTAVRETDAGMFTILRM